jgi:effector-binding domain-containing protein
MLELRTPTPPDISIQTVTARMLAAVRRQVRVDEIGSAWRPALDKVWEFLRQHPGLRTDGHNVFLYHHPAGLELPMDIDFGVEIIRPFEPSGDVLSTETPAGKVVTALHVGPYERLGETHQKIHVWAASNKVTFAGKSWEIYGDWADDASKLETRIEYLLS